MNDTTTTHRSKALPITLGNREDIRGHSVGSMGLESAFEFDSDL